MVKLGDICRFQSGGTPSKNISSYYGGNIPWITTIALNGSTISEKDAIAWITSTAIKETAAKIVPAQSILVGTRVGIGKIAINTTPISTNQDILALIDIDENTWNKKYLVHAISTKKTYLNDVSRGSTIKGIKKEILENLEIKKFSLIEQQKISNILDKVNALYFIRKQQLSKLDQLVKSRFVEMFGDPIRNEKNWPLVLLGEVAQIFIGPFGTLLHKEDYIYGGHALINPSHIVEGKIYPDNNFTISEEKYIELKAYHLQKDDIILGRRGEMGRCAVAECSGLICGTGSIIVRPYKKMKSYFIQSILSSPGYRKLIEDKAVGVTMLNLNVNIVSNIKVPLLPITMQENFINFLHKIDKAKSSIKQSLETLETLKKSLMQEYFG
ncbi:restriction endonuclease subunit S [uncultured Desulfovibrio sp.]|uniref:restriction endonuclease subunit S n=1 Tax=uncultured Desulfovibrio sp. TaxID=167968 RepID=UPI00260986EF|nr:restriction endonuclease subunit S [uncultured Desulfovibrio sp.]